MDDAFLGIVPKKVTIVPVPSPYITSASKITYTYAPAPEATQPTPRVAAPAEEVVPTVPEVSQPVPEED